MSTATSFTALLILLWVQQAAQRRALAVQRRYDDLIRLVRQYATRVPLDPDAPEPRLQELPEHRARKPGRNGPATPPPP